MILKEKVNKILFKNDRGFQYMQEMEFIKHKEAL